MAKSILDPSFKYTPSHSTDIRRTFRKARQQLEREGAQQRAKDAEPIKIEVDRVIRVPKQRWWGNK